MFHHGWRETHIRNQNRFLLVGLVVLWLILMIPWFWNMKKFIDCDFDSNYKCATIHLVGVVLPPTSFITVWFDDEASKNKLR